MELADKKMGGYIERFNQMTMSMDISQLSLGLYDGAMGLCIYFYELAGLTSERKYKMTANKLFNDTVNRITYNLEINPSNGLTGICMAVNYMIDAGYMEGNPNHILKSYDDRIIQLLLFDKLLESNPSIDRIQTVLGSLTYLTARLQNIRLSRNERQVMQGVIIELLNKTESLHIDKFTEPESFSVTAYFIPYYLQLLQRMYQLNFYNCKIEKIVDGLSPHILRLYPLNKANRLSLCAAMRELNAIVGGIPGWDRHIELLKHDLDTHQIIHEFRNKDITFNRGLCGFYYLLRKTGVKREYNDLFIHKIANSDVWDHVFEKNNVYILPFSLYNGALGVILTYLHIVNRSDAMMFFDKAIGQYV